MKSLYWEISIGSLLAKQALQPNIQVLDWKENLLIYLLTNPAYISCFPLINDTFTHIA